MYLYSLISHKMTKSVVSLRVGARCVWREGGGGGVIILYHKVIFICGGECGNKRLVHNYQYPQAI